MHRLYLTLALLLLSTGMLSAQHRVESRIAGLEQNGEYMTLLEREAQLQMREDSIASAMIRVRQQLREDPSNRQTYAREILQAENQIFEVRNAKGRIIDRINTIEQEWVLKNLDVTLARHKAEAQQQGGLPDSLKQRNLVDNRPFEQYLTRQDLNSLRRAQRKEMTAVDFVNRYLANYLSMSDAATAYVEVPTEEEALLLQRQIDSLGGINERLADSLAEEWDEIYDNKSYAYDYLFEALRKEEQLDRQQERHARTMREIRALEGETASDALVDYFLRKQALIEYELAVAEALTLGEAVDSLQGVREQVTSINFKLPAVTVEERIFIDYDTLTFAPRPQYSAQNPIPEIKRYQRGTIYRILLGTFNTKRPVTIFRGTAPITYEVTEEGKWRYYAGGFATQEEAIAAQERLRKRGFLRPEVVVWIDDQYRNLAEEPLPTATHDGFRLEITGVESLTEEVQLALRSLHPTAEVSRIGASRYIIGTFEERSAAEQAAVAMRAADGGLQIAVMEVTTPNEE